MLLQKNKFLLVLGFINAITFLACKGFENKKSVQTPIGFDWQGHRGCRGLMPENALPAFIEAVDFQEITTLELDVAISKDKQIIVSHEPWFNPSICRLPGGDTLSQKESEKVFLYQKTAAEIREFDCGSWGNTRFPQQKKQFAYKPTLREVVEAVRQKLNGRKIFWNIEIKSEPSWDGVVTPPVEEFATLLIEEIKSLGIMQNANIQSFDIRALQATRKIDKSIKLAFLIENAWSIDYNLNLLGFVPEIYSPYYLLVNKSLVKKCHSQNMKLIPWTVNDVASMKRLIRLGVDGIITDYPNLIQKVGERVH